MERTFLDPALVEGPVERVMGPRLPTVGSGQAIELAVELLDSAPALLVLDGGRPCSVLSRSDVLAFLSASHPGELP
jgi:cystathionine beta-synthase